MLSSETPPRRLAVTRERWLGNPPVATHPPSSLRGDAVAVSHPALQSCDSLSEYRQAPQNSALSLSN